MPDRMVSAPRSERLVLYVTVACVAGATLGLELVQTRILSALYYNHVVYLTVTIALMGFGIAGVLVSVFARRTGAIDRWCGFTLAAFAISSFVCIGAASYLPVWLGPGNIWGKLLLSYLVLVFPFMFAGASLGLIFRAHGRDIFRLYFADLAASALAAMCFALLLWPLGATGFIWLCSGTAVIAFLFHQVRVRARWWTSVVPPAAFLIGALALGEDLVNRRPEPYKVLGTFYDLGWSDADIEATAWTTLARIDVFPDVFDPREGTDRVEASTQQKWLTQDGDATTMMLGAAPVRSLLERTRNDDLVRAPGLAYFLHPGMKNVLVIGVGGGIDIVQAHAFDVPEIVGVEINPATVDFMNGPYRDFALWPEWPEVELVKAEGRHYIRTTEDTFDVIVMSAVDTFAALNSGAYVLSENYLYTTEAMEDYLAALAPDGIMLIFRWFFTEPRESLRLANLYLEAARRQGLASPERSIIVVAKSHRKESWWSAATLFKKEPFTAAQAREAVDRVMAADDLAMLFVPKVFAEEEQREIERRANEQFASTLASARKAYETLILSPTPEARAAFEADYTYNVSPVFDDKPFFFEYHKLSDLFANLALPSLALRGKIAHYALYYLLAISFWACLVAMIIPLGIFERQGLKKPGIGSLLAFFCSLGVGFMLVEIGIMQWLNLYLGHPIHSLTVVLAGLLLFAGLGSYVASLLPWPLARLAAIGTAGPAVGLILWVPSMGVVMGGTVLWPFEARVAVTLLSLAPLGLLMGFPFATGLRHLEEREPRFIPWAWGINGLTSVLASILAIILAMRFGFTTVLVLGSLVYAGGFVAIRAHLAGGNAAAE